MTELPPVTGAWRPGDDPGRRQFVTFDEGLKLEAGGRLEAVTVAYETWGELAPDASNAVLVLHALSLDSHAAGPAGPGHGDVGWWDGTVGPGCAIDTDRFFVVCPNVLGGCQGTTGPSSDAADGRPYGSRFPVTTIRDQVGAGGRAGRCARHRPLVRGRGRVDGRHARARVGRRPPRPRRSARVVISVGAQATAEEIALCHVQMRAIRADPKWRGGDYYDAEPGDGPHEGLAIARGIGHISYRTELELAARFGRDHQPGEEPFVGGRYAVESYIDYHGDKLVRRFDANTYLVLSEAMNHHDVGRDRGGIAAALATITADVTIVGHVVRLALPGAAPAGARRAHPHVVGGRDRADHLRPRRLPRRDRTPRPHHPPRPRLTPPNISRLAVHMRTRTFEMLAQGGVAVETASRAWWRSATRSSVVSMPTDRRTSAGSTASGESTAEAWVMRAGCSMSDSTPPSDSASVNSRVRGDELERGLLAARHEEAHHAAEVAHLPPRDRRGRGAPGCPG